MNTCIAALRMMAARFNSTIGRIALCLPMLAFGCATDPVQPKHNVACRLSDSVWQSTTATGIQFTNQCDQCMAVAFEYRQRGAESKWTACYVPAQSRVVFWDVNEYWLVAQKPCDEAKKHGLGGVSVAEMESNKRNGLCDSLAIVLQ